MSKKTDYKSLLKQIFFVPLGVFLIALPVKMLLAPLGISGAGIGGLAIIVNYLTNFPMSVFTLICNVILLILALILLSKRVFFKMVYGAFLFPLFLGIIPEYALTHDVMLAVLFTSLSCAIGTNILYYLNSSSGGTTIPPLILKKYFGLSEAAGLFISDGIIVVISAFVFGIESFMYSALAVILTSVIMESMSNGISRKKNIFIISKNHEKIADDVLKHIGRGATYLQAKGAYSNDDIQVLMIILNSRDYFKLQSIVNEHDPNAFVIVQNAQKVIGDAFRYHGTQVKKNKIAKKK